VALFEQSRTLISDFRENQPVDEIFLVCSKSLRYSRSGSPFLALELGDRSGRIQARIWDNAEVLQTQATVDGFVRVRGKVALFNDTPQINVTEMEAVSDSEVDLSQFQPTSSRDLAEMETELREIVGRVSCPYLRALSQSFFDEPAFWSDFRRAPAAKMIHHATIGGLLEHTLAVALLCDDIARRYAGRQPEMDRDLLVTGALLHDIGKTRELSWRRQFDYTTEGRLVGHIVLGAEMVTERFRAIAGRALAQADPQSSPALAARLEEKLLRLRHMLLSHHGQYEWGSPKRPKFVEALVLHYADDLTAKVDTFGEFLQSERARDPEGQWTSYNSILDRYLYKGPGGRENGGA
jgi:3'-5' exoribonuclease